MYTVESGDILSTVARDHAMSVEGLKIRNDLTSDMIYLGQMLIVKSTREYDSPAPLAEQHMRVNRRRDARLELGNKSDYVVSYWVVQEEKMKTEAVQERILYSVEGSLNTAVGIAEGASVGVGATAKREKETTTEKAGSEYLLLADCRINPRTNDYRQRVPFPRDGTDLRVYAYFRTKGNKRWVLYKNQVCSNATGYMACLLDATNEVIEPYR